MIQKILEDMLKVIRGSAGVAPEFIERFAELTELNGSLIAKDEISAEELAKLKIVCSDVMNAMDSQTAIMPYVKALKDPMTCYMNNLTEGTKNLSKAAADTSWLDNYIGSPEAIEEDENYKPEPFKIEGMSYAQVIEKYKEEAKVAKKGFDKHVARLSKDDEQPHETFDAKMQVITSLLSTYKDVNVPQSFSEMARNAYRRANIPVNLEKVNSLLVVSGQLLCDYFYNISTDNFYDFTIAMGDIKNMKTVDDDTRKRLHDISDKIRLKTKNLGVNKKDIEIMSKTGYALGNFQMYIGSILLDEPDAASNQDNPLYPVMTELKKQSNNIIDCLHNAPGAKPPTAEDLKPLVEKIGQYIDKQDVINDYVQFRLSMRYLDNMVKELAVQYPELKETSEKITNCIKTKGKNKYDLLVRKISEKPEPDHYNIMNAGIRDLYRSGFVTRDYNENMRFYRMATNPQFCDDEILRARKALDEMVESHSASNGSGFNSKSSDFDQHEFFVDDKTIYKEAIKTVLLGEIMKSQAGNTVKSLEDFETKFGGFDDITIANQIYDMNPKDFLVLANDAKMLKTATTLIQQKENPYLDLIDARSLGALTEKSKSFGASNSNMYNKIRDSIELIQRKDKGVRGGSLEDYHELLKNCSDYLIHRSSEAGSPSGKKRFAAAAKILRTIGPKLMAKLPQKDADQIYKDMVTNMFRSKDFRNKCIAEAKERIIKTFGKDANINEEGYKKLTSEQKKALEQDFKILHAANEVTDAMKGTKFDQIMTEKDLNNADQELLKSYVNALTGNSSVMKNFHKDPAVALGDAVGIKAPEAKPEDVQPQKAEGGRHI